MYILTDSRKIWVIRMTSKQENIYLNLEQQIEKELAPIKSGQGYRGSNRYRAGAKAFAAHLVNNYNGRSFKNITLKHLSSFVEASRELEISDSTLKTDLSAIRKMHRIQCERSGKRTNDGVMKGDNTILGILKIKKKIYVDRATTQEETQAAINLAISMERFDVANAIEITRICGTRIEEVTALRRTDLKDAILNGHLSLRKTKGGIPRDVPITEEDKNCFRSILVKTTNENLFIGKKKNQRGPGLSHEQAIKSIQNWIANNRDNFDFGACNLKECERDKITFHSLRHEFSRKQYINRIKRGMNKRQARLEVSQLLGHGRDEVTKIYLAEHLLIID